LTLLGDQSAGKKGCWVKFFDRPASTHKAVALFSLGNEATTMVSYARRIGRPLQYEVGPAAIVDPRAATLNFAPSRSAQWYTATIGAADPPGARSVLVAPQTLEGPTTERALRKSAMTNAAA